MQKFRTSLLALASSIFTSGSLFADTITVDNNPGSVAMFDNFEDAYEAASNGDTILLAGSSTYYGSFSIYKQLKIVGPGFRLTENGVPGLNPESAKIQFSCSTDSLIGTSAGSEFEGLELRITVDSNISGIIIQKCYGGSFIGNSWQFSSPVVVKSCLNSSITFFDTSTGSVVSNCLLAGTTFYATGLTADRCVFYSSFNGNPSTSITNSLFVFSNAANFSPNSTSVSRCMAVGFNTLPAGGGNINGQLIGNVFLNTGSEDGKWRLKAGSPAAGAGTGGSDMGAFGGPNPYVLSGAPGIPKLTRLIVPATATSTSGLQFEVEAQAFAE